MKKEKVFEDLMRSVRYESPIHATKRLRALKEEWGTKEFMRIGCGVENVEDMNVVVKVLFTTSIDEIYEVLTSEFGKWHLNVIRERNKNGTR